MRQRVMERYDAILFFDVLEHLSRLDEVADRESALVHEITWAGAAVPQHQRAKVHPGLLGPSPFGYEFFFEGRP